MVTKCIFEDYNEDRDIKASKSNNKNSSKDNGEDDNKNNNKDNKKNKEFQDKIDIDLDKLIKTLCYKYINFILL